MELEQLYQANKVMASIENLKKLQAEIPVYGIGDFTQVEAMDFIQEGLDNLDLRLFSIAIEAKTSTEVLWNFHRINELPEPTKSIVIHTLGADGSSTWHDDVGACVNGSPDDGCDACNRRDQRNMGLGW